MSTLTPGPEDAEEQEEGADELANPTHDPTLSLRTRSQEFQRSHQPWARVRVMAGARPTATTAIRRPHHPKPARTRRGTAPAQDGRGHSCWSAAGPGCGAGQVRILAFWLSNSSALMTPLSRRSASLVSWSAVLPEPAASWTY